MSLGKKFASGTGWLAMGAVADYAMQFLIFMLLARLVSVTDLGIVSFALVLTDVGRIFVNGGRAELIVRHPEWNDRLASVAFTRTLVSAGGVAALLATLGAWLIDRYYQAGGGLPTTALSLIFVIEALRTVQAAKMRREFRFRSLAFRAIFSTLVSGAIAVVLALSGWGVWALVMQRLISQVMTTGLTLWAARWRPHLLWSDPSTEGTEDFTRKVTLSRVLDVAVLRMPDFLIGLLIGPAAVAFYRVGARSLEAIIRIVVQPFQDASMSVYSRLPDPAAVGNALSRISRVALLVLMPVFIGSAIVGSDLTILLFSKKYAAAGPIMTVLAFGSIAQAMTLLFSSAYLGSGRAQALFVTNILSLAVTATGIVTGGLLGGTWGAAVGTAIAQWMLCLAGIVLIRRNLGIPVRALVTGIAFPLVASLLMALACLAVRHAGLGTLPILPRLILTCIVGGAVYSLLLLLSYRVYLRPVLLDVGPVLPAKLRAFLPK